MLATCGHPVDQLKRLRFGTIQLGALPEKSYEPLKQEQVEELLRSATMLRKECRGGEEVGEDDWI